MFTAAPFPEGCTLPPEQCEAAAIVEAGARRFDAEQQAAAQVETSPAAGVLAVVLALVGLFALLSSMTDRAPRRHK